MKTILCLILALLVIAVVQGKPGNGNQPADQAQKGFKTVAAKNEKAKARLQEHGFISACPSDSTCMRVSGLYHPEADGDYCCNAGGCYGIDNDHFITKLATTWYVHYTQTFEYATTKAYAGCSVFGPGCQWINWTIFKECANCAVSTC
eukprot:332137_1